MMYMFDIETLGIESTTVVLSAAIIKFDPTDKTRSYEDYINSACFVKFDVEEQVEKYKRTMDKGTLEWWSQQHEHVRKISLVPNRSLDVSVEEGIGKIMDYLGEDANKQITVWARGSLDQMAIDSLCKAAKLPMITWFNNWRDVRTALDCLTETSKNGYCQLKIPFDSGATVIKHDPVHDCAYDIMMLVHGK